MCNCVYCRQEPDFAREQATRNNIDTAWERGYAAGKIDSVARYQIKRAIAQLEQAPGYEAQLNIPTVLIIKTVIIQLKAYLLEA